MRGVAVHQLVDPLLGTLIADRYVVLQELGAGGFGTVYMAEHAKLKQPVAIKVLHQHLLRDNEVRARFEREAEAASRLQHPAMARVHDVGLLADGRPYMIMEYLSGETLADIIKREGPVKYLRALPWFIQCCDALRYAHKKGMLHRDIKPDNIFVLRDDAGVERAKLLDFGLAKLVHGDGEAAVTALTESGITMGTPWYMSPEQCAARPLDGRSDLYSLAYSLYEAIAGRRPFPGRTHYEAMDAHLHSILPPLNREYCDPVVPVGLDQAIQKACAKAPNDRYSTADEFRAQLEKAMDRNASPMLTPLRAPIALARETLSAAGDVDVVRVKARRKKGRKRSSLVLVAMLAALVGLLGTAGGVVLLKQGLELQRAVAKRQAHTPQSGLGTELERSGGQGLGRMNSEPQETDAATMTKVKPELAKVQVPPRVSEDVIKRAVELELKKRLAQQQRQVQVAPPVVAKEVAPVVTVQQQQQRISRNVMPKIEETPLIEPLQFPESTLKVGHYITEDGSRPRMNENEPPPNYGPYGAPQVEQPRQPQGVLGGMPAGPMSGAINGPMTGPMNGPFGPNGGGGAGPMMPMPRR